jgi:carbamoyltransferase
MSSIYGFYTGSHSSACSLIVDGNIVSCVEEERMTRIKAGDDYNSNAEMSSEEIQKISGIKFTESDYNIFVEPVPKSFAKKITKDRYEVVSHHDAHAYGAYFTSGFEGKTMTITHDGGGESSLMKMFLCEDGKMTLLRDFRIASFGTLSHLWGFSTSGILGYDEWGEGLWKMCKDEGKLMGMAANGYLDEEIYKMLNTCIDYENFRFFPSVTAMKTKFLMDMMFLEGRFDSQKKREVFSFTLQTLTNNLFLKFMEDIHKTYPEYTKFCFAGGLFANVKLNQKINELDWVDEIYIYPPMGDEGLSLGACIMKSVELGEWTKPKKFKNLYFSKSYTNEEIYEISQQFDFERVPYIPSEMAEKINNGGIIGFFNGGSEYGPRALGARSILVKPTEPDTHRELNRRLKRHDTMPFAPIVLSEHFDDLFYPSKSKYASEFMTICFSTKEEWIDKIPAVIQKSDKTARPQIVNKDKLPKFWEILNEYYSISDIPVLLNTSFNSHNEPIIENPVQAFRTLNEGIIDELIIEDYVYYPKR